MAVMDLHAGGILEDHGFGVEFQGGLGQVRQIRDLNSFSECLQRIGVSTLLLALAAHDLFCRAFLKPEHQTIKA